MKPKDLPALRTSFEKDLFALGRYVEWGNFKWMQSQNEEVLRCASIHIRSCPLTQDDMGGG